MHDSSWLWLSVALLFALAEMGNPGLFFFLSFAFGACFAAGFALVVPLFEWQIAAFLVATILCMYGLKRWVSLSRGTAKSTNSAALVGRRVAVVSDITPDNPGTVTFDGTVWTAHSYQDSFLKGDRVVIHRIKGAHVVVVKSVGKHIL